MSSAEKNFAQSFLEEAVQILGNLDVSRIEQAAHLLAKTRMSGGRLFILGVGGCGNSTLDGDGPGRR